MNLFASPDPAIRRNAEQTKDSGGQSILGPMTLKNGGLGMISRQAVFDEGRFWGFVSVVRAGYSADAGRCRTCGQRRHRHVRQIRRQAAVRAKRSVRRFVRAGGDRSGRRPLGARRAAGQGQAEQRDRCARADNRAGRVARARFAELFALRAADQTPESAKDGQGPHRPPHRGQPTAGSHPRGAGRDGGRAPPTAHAGAQRTEAAAGRLPRRGDGAVQPDVLSGAARGDDRRGRAAAANHSRCCSSTWINSS